MRDWLKELTGVGSLTIFFGFVGGCLSLSLGGARTPLVAIASVFAGLFCATAFTPVVHHFWAFPDDLQPAVGFTLGLIGFNLIKLINEKLRGETLANIFSRWISRGISSRPDDKDDAR